MNTVGQTLGDPGMRQSHLLEKLASLVPRDLLDCSGSVFYAGRDAFSGNRPLYILGANPGGSPESQAGDTVSVHIEKVLQTVGDNWSEYRDESWKGAPAGSWGMQPRVLHLFRKLGLDPGTTPASNLIFLRSGREADLKGNVQDLAEKCWAVHSHAIQALACRTILCFGGTAGTWVRKRLDAHELVAEFVERNQRKWRSRAHLNREGIAVITATHPSIADWTNPAADPAPLIKEVLGR